MREMTIAEASERFGIKPRTLWMAINEGRVEARQSGRTWLLTPHALAVAVIGGRVRVDKAMVDELVREYLAQEGGDDASR